MNNFEKNIFIEILYVCVGCMATMMIFQNCWPYIFRETVMQAFSSKDLLAL